MAESKGVLAATLPVVALMGWVRHRVQKLTAPATEPAEATEPPVWQGSFAIPYPAPPPETQIPDPPEEPSTAGQFPAGQFPVLETPSPAARRPWLLAEHPSPPGVAADQARVGGLEVRAASVVGCGHRTDAVPRQDAFRLGRTPDSGFLVAAVADGMSDSRHAEVGAAVAATALVSAIVRDLGEPGDSGESANSARTAFQTPGLRDLDARRLFTEASAVMYQAARQRGWEADDVRAVAVAAAVCAEPGADGLHAAWIACVADAGAWLLRRGEWHRVTGQPKSGLDQGHLEAYLPFTPERVTQHRVALEPEDLLLLATDGVSDAFDSVAAAQGWFAGRWSRPVPLGAFLLDVGFEQRQLNDDRTAVAVWCDGRASQSGPKTGNLPERASESTPAGWGAGR